MTQIKIKYVNEPKAGGSGKFGSLKDFDGVTYMVPARFLASFMAGTVVDVELKQETWGTSQMNVVQGPPNGPATNGTNPVRLTPAETSRVVGMAGRADLNTYAQQGLGYPSGTAGAGGNVANAGFVGGTGQALPGARTPTGSQERMIFVTGVTGRAMGSGVFTPEHIRILALAAADAWDELHR